MKKVSKALYESMYALIQNIATDHDLDAEALVAKYLPQTPPEGCSKGSAKGSAKGRRAPKIKDEEYIETEEYFYKGRTYLVDSNGVVYSNNTNRPVILGKRLPDGIIRFTNFTHPPP